MLKVRTFVVLIFAILFSFNSLSFAAILGDANGNGKLDVSDAIITLQTLVGLRSNQMTNIIGIWQTSNYPQSDSGQFIFNADGSFSSIFYEQTKTTSSGTYTYSNNALTLFYIQSTNSNLVGTTEQFNNVTLSENQLSTNGATFIIQSSGVSYFEVTRSAETLTGWNPVNNPVNNVPQITVSGTSSIVSQSGFSTIENDVSLSKAFANAMGIAGTINVSAINGNAAAGFGMYVGAINGNKIHVNISLQNGDQGTYVIKYVVRLANATNQFVGYLAYGYLGMMGTINNTDMTIGFARVGNEIWFYADGYPFIKWDPQMPMGNRADNNIWYWVWTGGSMSSIAANFKNIKIIY
jgi:hypothetical protein